MEWVRHLAGADCAVWYTMAAFEDLPRPARHQILGGDPWHRALETGLRQMSAQGIRWVSGSPRRPRRSWQQSFLESAALWPRPKQLQRSSFWTRVLEPLRIRDQIRLLVYHQGRFVGWIGALRSHEQPAFGPDERHALQPLVDPVASALTAADAAERAESFAELEGGADLIVKPDGHVEFASPNARGWITESGRRPRIAQTVREIDRGRWTGHAMVDGALVRWSRLAGRQGSVRYLLHLTPAEPVHLAPDAALSAAQREVASLVASGATLRHVGRALGISRDTARTHLRRCYERLGVRDRTELARRLAA
jgi:DNA-binding CsgD family transcriptional regulator